MKLSGCALVILLLYFQKECFATTKREQWTYSYKGQIDTRSAACNESLARWTISGQLIVQPISSSIILQLENLKTSVFNGLAEDLEQVQEKEITDDVKILLKPFVIQKNEDDITIGVTPNEPLWAVNMKRSIGSQFILNMEQIFNKENITLINKKESTIFGDCNVHYDLAEFSKTNPFIKKVIHHNECENIPLKHKSNVKRATATKDFNPIQITTHKLYKLKLHSILVIVTDISSNTTITYQSMPSQQNTLHVDQYQEFKMIKDDLTDKVINIEANTERRNIIYEFDHETFFSRHKPKLSQNELVKQFFEDYEAFNKHFDTLPLQYFNVRDTDHVDNMFLTLLDMNEEGFKKIDEELQHINNPDAALTLLPYIGTNYTTKYIADLLENNLTFKGSEYQGIKFLATLPYYIENPTEEQVKSFEIMLNLKHISQPIMRNFGVLSFASIVDAGHKKNLIGSKKFEEYRNLFYNKFLHEENYDQKMIYLLSLVNIAEGLTEDFIIPILTNTSESKHLRSLGMTGFKSRLITVPEKVYKNFWPIFINETEPFEIRVASLDLLMSTNLSEEQFNSIVKVCNKPQQDIHNKHLSNYFYTTILSLQNLTRYSDPLGPLASALFEKEHFPEFTKNLDIWTTSNYRVSYTDDEPNFGKSFQARLISDPLTNTFNIIHFTYNHFGFSFDLGTYSIYLKLDKWFELEYKIKFLKFNQAEMSVPELIQLLNEYSFKMKEENSEFHAEIVIFIDDRAVFALHMHPGNLEIMKQFFIDFITLPPWYDKMLSFPLMNYNIIPSDLGTPIKIMNDMQDVTVLGNPLQKEYFRNYWYYQTWLESYNPLADTTIATYKYHGEEKSVNITFDLNLITHVAAWHHWNDSFNYISDKQSGTIVEDEYILKKYCPQCDNYNEIPADLTAFRLRGFDAFGISLNYSDPYYNSNYSHILKNHHSNTNSLYGAKSFLLLLHTIDDIFYFQHELGQISYRTMPYYGNVTRSVAKLVIHDDYWSQDPLYVNFYKNVALSYTNAKLERDYDENRWTMKFTRQIAPKKVEEGMKPKIALTFSFDIDLTRYNDTSFKMCVNREILFPHRKSDKFSIVPSEPISGETIIDFGKFNGFLKNCPTNNTIILTDHYWTSNELINKVKSMKEYKKCTDDSTGLIYTPPSAECLLIAQLLPQYDNYEAYLNFTMRPHGPDDQETKDLETYPFIVFSKISDNKLNMSLFKSPLWHDFEENETDLYWNNTIYFPNYLVNPNVLANNEFKTLDGTLRTCIITPKTIKSFTGVISPFEEKNPVAMIECFNKILKGLTIQKVNDKNVCFKLWFYDYLLIATVVDNGNIEIKLDGNVIEKSTDYEPNTDFKIIFLESNIIYIKMKDIQIYYNTEYIIVNAEPLYNTLLCGFCSYDHK